jgi:hypothetical protein
MSTSLLLRVPLELRCALEDEFTHIIRNTTCGFPCISQLCPSELGTHIPLHQTAGRFRDELASVYKSGHSYSPLLMANPGMRPAKHYERALKFQTAAH